MRNFIKALALVLFCLFSDSVRAEHADKGIRKGEAAANGPIDAGNEKCPYTLTETVALNRKAYRILLKKGGDESCLTSPFVPLLIRTWAKQEKKTPATYRNGEGEYFWILTTDEEMGKKPAPEKRPSEKIIETLNYRHSTVNPEPLGVPADSVEAKVARHVGMLVSEDTGDNFVNSCTATLIADDIILTNDHCLSSLSSPDKIVFVAGYNERKEYRAFDCPELIDRDRALDVAVLRCKGKPGASFGHARLSDEAVAPSSPVFLVGHPQKREQTLVRGRTHAHDLGLLDRSVQTYLLTGSGQGTSGSLVFNTEGRAIALHDSTLGGSKMSYILQYLFQLNNEKKLGLQLHSVHGERRSKLPYNPDGVRNRQIAQENPNLSLDRAAVKANHTKAGLEATQKVNRDFSSPRVTIPSEKLPENSVPQQVARAVGRFKLKEEYKRSNTAGESTTRSFTELCTATMLTADVAIVASHCVKGSLEGAEIIFDYRQEIQDSAEHETGQRFRCSQLIKRDEKLDLALIRCEGQPGVKRGVVALAETPAPPGTPVFALHYQWGGEQRYTPGSLTFDDEEYPTIDSNLALGPGASGSLLLRSDGVAVGLNQGGASMRQGDGMRAARMREVLAFIKREIPSLYQQLGEISGF